MRINRGILNALAAAVLFGASTPIAKILVEQMPPVLLAGLLYAGSGVGLFVGLLVRRLVRSAKAPGGFALPRGEDLKWLAGAVLFGGVLGPVLLMLGLSSTPASASALLLNLEGVFTALRSAELLTATVHSALTSGDLSQGTLARYAAARRREFAAKSRVTHALQFLIARRRLANVAAHMLVRRPALLDALLGVFGDFVPPAELLSPALRRPA